MLRLREALFVAKGFLAPQIHRYTSDSQIHLRGNMKPIVKHLAITNCKHDSNKCQQHVVISKTHYYLCTG